MVLCSGFSLVFLDLLQHSFAVAALRWAASSSRLILVCVPRAWQSSCLCPKCWHFQQRVFRRLWLATLPLDFIWGFRPLSQMSPGFSPYYCYFCYFLCIKRHMLNMVQFARNLEFDLRSSIIRSPTNKQTGNNWIPWIQVSHFAAHQLFAYVIIRSSCVFPNKKCIKIKFWCIMMFRSL